MLYEKQASGTAEDILARLAAAVAAHKFGVISQLDLQAKLAEKGVDLAPVCWVVEVCNPVQAQRVLEQEITLATMLPCRLCLYERAGALWVGTLRPSQLIGLMGQPALAPVAAEVEATLIAIIDQTCA
ncbi:DUF302 domain-containing protein [bacterium]|nr:DUF302 domain-containing protein [bacterium]